MNSMENYVCIGDVHGRYDLLQDLLAQIEKHPNAGFRKVFLGDMVDRGPDSFKIVQTAKDLVEKENAIALFGNHEDMMIDYIDQGVPNRNHIWLYNGGNKTIESYGKEMKAYGQKAFFGAARKSLHYNWIKNLPLYYETDKVWFSHAPMPRERYRSIRHYPLMEGVTVDYRHDKEMLTWSYHENAGVTEDVYAHPHGKTAVCGHIHAVRDGIFTPRIYENIIYADTGSGCYYKAPLTAVFLTDGKYTGYLQAYPKNQEPVMTEELLRAFQKTMGE